MKYDKAMKSPDAVHGKNLWKKKMKGWKKTKCGVLYQVGSSTRCKNSNQHLGNDKEV
jgi:hypothetical protein